MIKSPFPASASQRRRFPVIIIAAVIIIGMLQGCAKNPPSPPETTATAGISEEYPDINTKEQHYVTEQGSSPTTDNDVNDIQDKTPDGSEQELSGNYLIGVLAGDNSSEYISSVCAALEKEAAKLSDLTLSIYGSGNDQAMQNNQLSDIIRQDIKCLIISMADISAAQNVIDVTSAAGLPVIFIGREPPEEIIKSHERARFVGTASYEPGTVQGGIIIELWKTNLFDTNKDGIMQYVMIKGTADSSESLVASEYSIKTVEDNGIKTFALDSQYCDWDFDKSSAAMASWIERFGDEIEFVIANSDEMAMGAITALQAAGYNTGERFMPVVGIGASSEALNLIADGIMSGTVGPDAETTAKVVLTLAHNVAKGNKFLSETPYSYDSSNVALRIPYLSYISE